MHIYDARFPLAAKARRQEPDALVSAYRKVQRALGLERVVVVQPTAYGKDNRCTLEALAQFGDSARGVAIIDDATSEAEIERLTRGGMRGVRFRMTGDPELPWEMLPRMAARMAKHGWHIQFQMDGANCTPGRRCSAPCLVNWWSNTLANFLNPSVWTIPGFRRCCGSSMAAAAGSNCRALTWCRNRARRYTRTSACWRKR
jgi:D-galactarolactone isomerase